MTNLGTDCGISISEARDELKHLPFIGHGSTNIRELVKERFEMEVEASGNFSIQAFENSCSR